jgi:glucosamine--fructose-6-phosphate aminotransferase (isomerizing)
MCGIFAVVGHRDAYSTVREGLLRLAYRGYDSAGIALENSEPVKTLGHPENLKSLKTSARWAIGHNRWATHGKPSIPNAHPHRSMNKDFTVVHNGIVENYLELKEFLKYKGYKFISDTDTEVIPNLLSYYADLEDDLESAIEKAVKNLKGSYALVIHATAEPDSLYLVRLGSPAVIGVDDSNSYYVSSDMTTLPKETRYFREVEENSLYKLNNEYRFSADIYDWIVFKPIKEVYDLGNFPDFMTKEISHQIASLPELLSRPTVQQTQAKNVLLSAHQIILVGCGSAFYASMVGARVLEKAYRKPVRVMSAGELQYQEVYCTENSVLVAVSQSGETADTIRCVQKYNHLQTISVCNTPNSTLSKLCTTEVQILAGKEISVASTKAVTHQALTLFMLSENIRGGAFLKNIDTLVNFKKFEVLCEKLVTQYSIIALSRGHLLAPILETALKIKELAYIHTEGLSASEFKHGPLALISNSSTCLAFIDETIEDKIVSNIKEVQSREGKVVAVVSKGCRKETKSILDYYVEIDTDNPVLNPILFIIAGQIITYNLAKSLGKSIDRPRNLAKSVTVE